MILHEKNDVYLVNLNGDCVIVAGRNVEEAIGNARQWHGTELVEFETDAYGSPDRDRNPECRGAVRLEDMLQTGNWNGISGMYLTIAQVAKPFSTQAEIIAEHTMRRSLAVARHEANLKAKALVDHKRATTKTKAALKRHKKTKAAAKPKKRKRSQASIEKQRKTMNESGRWNKKVKDAKPPAPPPPAPTLPVSTEAPG